MRGVYGKREGRTAAPTLPCAWTVGDRKSFMAARARALKAILLDLELSGHHKAALAVCIGHLNPDEQWSCFASIPKMAKEADLSKTTFWKAIKLADGKHIATRRKGKSTYITLFPKVREREPLEAPKVRDLGRERSANAEHNSYTDNSIKEGGRSEKEESFGVFIQTDTPQWAEWRKYKGRIPEREFKIGGRIRRGYYLPSEWPPTHKQIGAQVA
jgi:hypothetical protein